MKSEVSESYGVVTTKVGIDEAAAKATMRSLLNLTVDANDSTVYFNRVSIANGIPPVYLYGSILQSDVPQLLEPYIGKHYVRVARIRHRTGGKEHVGYRADLSKRQQIEAALAEKTSSVENL